MDGWADFDRYQIQPGGSCDCGDRADLGIWAAVRGRTLYVATRTIPPGGQYDYFIMVNAAGYFWAPAPWGKAGNVPFQNNQPFIGAESTNNYVGWFNAPASAQVVRSAVPGGVIEGTLDLVETFGYMPEYISLIAVAYETWDGGHLVAQSPWGNKDDFVDGNEVRFPTIMMLRDEDQDGLFDRIDPEKGWRISSIQRESDGSRTISVPAVPRRTFTLQISNVGPGGPFYDYSGSTGTDNTPFVSVNDYSPAGSTRFYRVKIERY